MKTIAIDLDSVLADVMIIWIEEYNRIRGSTIIKNDITAWDIHTILPINDIECNILFSMVWKNRWKEIPPTNKNIEKIIRDLNKENRISIITKREKDTIPFVYEWLKYNNIEYDDLLFVPDEIPKSVYPFNFLIDDNPNNLVDIKFPKKGILFDQPWNKNFNWPRRIHSLDEIRTVICL